MRESCTGCRIHGICDAHFAARINRTNQTVQRVPQEVLNPTNTPHYQGEVVTVIPTDRWMKLRLDMLPTEMDNRVLFIHPLWRNFTVRR